MNSDRIHWFIVKFHKLGIGVCFKLWRFTDYNTLYEK